MGPENKVHTRKIQPKYTLAQMRFFMATARKRCNVRISLATARKSVNCNDILAPPEKDVNRSPFWRWAPKRKKTKKKKKKRNTHYRSVCCFLYLNWQ